MRTLTKTSFYCNWQTAAVSKNSHSGVRPRLRLHRTPNLFPARRPKENSPPISSVGYFPSPCRADRDACKVQHLGRSNARTQSHGSGALAFSLPPLKKSSLDALYHPRILHLSL